MWRRLEARGTGVGGLEGVAGGVEEAGRRGTGCGWGWRAWHGAWWGLEGVAQGVEWGWEGVARGVGKAGQGVARGVGEAGGHGTGCGWGWRAWHRVWVRLEGVARGVEGAGACGKGRGVGWRAWHTVLRG